MKALAKTLLVQGVRALPLRARRIILDDVARNIGDFKAAGNIAKRVGLTDSSPRETPAPFAAPWMTMRLWQNMQETRLVAA